MKTQEIKCEIPTGEYLFFELFGIQVVTKIHKVHVWKFQICKN